MSLYKFQVSMCVAVAPGASVVMGASVSSSMNLSYAIALAGTTRIIIFGLRVVLRMFDKQRPVQPICLPSTWIGESNLKRKFHLRLQKDKVASPVNIGICHIGVGP